jgi:hypothetical protein
MARQSAISDFVDAQRGNKRIPSAYTEWATDDDGTPRLECNSAWMMLYPVKAAFAESAAGDLMGSNGFEPAAPASIILAWAVRIRT